MAIWQFSFHLIPKSEYKKKKGISSLDDIVDNVTWDEYKLSEKSIKDISLVLKPTKSWCEDIKQYGELESTCIELSYHYQSLESIQVRLDLRHLTKEVIDNILLFANLNDSIIVTDNNIIHPNVDDLIREIKRSNAFSFIQNPEDFLNTLHYE